MNADHAMKKLIEAREAVRKIMANMQSSGELRYEPLLVRGRLLLSNLDYQIENMRRAQRENELGVIPFVPLAWAAGAAALGFASKWISDAWSASKQSELYQADVVRVGPERAAQLQRERLGGGAGVLLDKLMGLLILVVGGFIVLRLIK